MSQAFAGSHPLAQKEADALELLQEALDSFDVSAEDFDGNSDDYPDADADPDVNYAYGHLHGIRAAGGVGL